MTQGVKEIESAETELDARLSVEQRERMRTLIAELVKTNQELRFKVARLKEKLSGLRKACPMKFPWAGMLI
jgi:regulator of replication initiation timing